MSRRKHQDEDGPPDLDSEFLVSLTTGLVFALLVMLMLPISQYITTLRERLTRTVELVDYQPPEVPPEPPPPEDIDDEADIDDVEEQREPPTLDQLELALNPDVSGLAGGDFTVPDFQIGAGLDEIIYELGDLSHPPRPTFQPDPIYPPELRSARISGQVILEFVVSADGTTRNIRVHSSTNPAFDESAMRAVRRWRFEPGEKDGQAVNTRVRQLLRFSPR